MSKRKRRSRVPSSYGLPGRIAGVPVSMVPFTPRDRDLFVVCECGCDQPSYYVRPELDGTTRVYMPPAACEHVVAAVESSRELVSILGRYRLAGDPWPYELEHAGQIWHVAPEHWCAHSFDGDD